MTWHMVVRFDWNRGIGLLGILEQLYRELKTELYGRPEMEC